jgi:DnaD/phage-associated family protein
MPNRQLILPENPLLVLPTLASSIGMNESIILQQMQYWILRTSNHRDGYKWVYNTYEDWAKQFPFWSVTTIRRAITKLENLGILVTGNYNQLKLDKTKWYRIDYQRVDDLFSSFFQQETEQDSPLDSPCDQSVSSELQTDFTEVTNLDRPLPESTSENTSKIYTVEKRAHANNPLTPHSFYEENGFGTIGGYISQKITQWCIDLSDELVIEAMKFAIENGSKTWAYVEAILRDWVDKQYTSVSEIHAARQRYKEIRSNKKPPNPNRKKEPNPFKTQVPSPEDLVRIGLSLGKTTDTIVSEVQQHLPLLDKEEITAIIKKRMNFNKESEKRTKERANRFEALLRKIQEEAQRI